MKRVVAIADVGEIEVESDPGAGTVTVRFGMGGRTRATIVLDPADAVLVGRAIAEGGDAASGVAPGPGRP